jgi:hypothetical protein
MDVVSYALSKKYANKLSCGIAGSSYDPVTSTMRVELNDGGSYDVVFDDGVTTQDRLVLDNIKYDEDTSTLQVDGKDVLTAENTESEDIDFSGMF